MPDRRPLLEQSRKYDWIERCLGCQALNKPIILAHEQCPLTRAAFVTTTEKRKPPNHRWGFLVVDCRLVGTGSVEHHRVVIIVRNRQSRDGAHHGDWIIPSRGNKGVSA